MCIRDRILSYIGFLFATCFGCSTRCKMIICSHICNTGLSNWLCILCSCKFFLLIYYSYEAVFRALLCSIDQEGASGLLTVQFTLYIAIKLALQSLCVLSSSFCISWKGSIRQTSTVWMIICLSLLLTRLRRLLLWTFSLRRLVLCCWLCNERTCFFAWVLLRFLLRCLL